MITVTFDKAIKCNGELSAFLQFPYNAELVDTVRELPDRYWNTETKTWEIPAKKVSALLAQFPRQEFELIGISKLAETVKKTADVPAGFSFKTTPFQHQTDGFQFGLDNTRWLLGDEQGLGKTKQAIDIAVAKKLQKHYKHCLIVCGVNGLKWNWVNEIATHSNEASHILGQRVRKDGKIVIGSTKDKYNDALALDSINAYFIVTNVETLRDEKIAQTLNSACKSGLIGMVVVDEVHKCKNPSSQQGKGILKLQPEYRLAMTGTPLMNQPLDLYIILKWLGYENHSFHQFKNYYCEMGGYGGYQVVGYRHLSDLREQLADIMLRRLKSEVLDLPEKLYVDEFVEMTPKQKLIYDEVTQSIKMNIDQIKMQSNPLAELIRMRQATGYTGILSSTIQESAKLDRMEELVEEAVSNGKQVVIFSNWTQMTDAVWKRLHSKYRVSVITGETKDVDRQDNVAEFQSGASQIILGTIGAMGTGLTLTAGTVEIFLDEPWNRANKEQAEDRCHRVGTTQNVTIYTLLCKNTIDERIHELVYKKGALADALVDGKKTENMDSILDFLLS